MRFRYFDASGNEVSLSTAAALAIKIDLGEVTETTLLYDQTRDEWAPAGEQEIYHHIVEHGVPEATDDPVDSAGGAGAGSGRPTAPPLADFWGPAMSSSPGEEESEDAMESFDLSLDSLSSDREASDTPGASDEILGDLSDPASEPPDEGSQDAPGSRTEEKKESRAEGPSPRRSRRSGRRRDPSLAKLEAIARQATERMEQQEALRRKRESAPSLGDRVAEGARKGGHKTGEALKSGAATSARALSEGGKATAETVGAGMRALGKGIRRARPRVRKALGSAVGAARGGASGVAGAMLGTLGRLGWAVAAVARGIAAGIAAVVRGSGVALGFVGRAAVAVAMAPARGALLAWRMLAPIGGRAGKEARQAAGAGMRGLRRAVVSPLALGLVFFASAFFVFTYGGGREAGEELWQATVGIARSVAAEADETPESPESEAAPATDGTGGVDRVAGGTEDNGSRTAAAATAGSEPEPSSNGESDPVEDGSAAVLPEDDSVAAAAAALEETVVAEFGEELALASEGALQDMIAAMDSLERVFQLPAAPPEEWLGGYYLAHATEFHDVRQYWARYRGYIRSVKARDAVLYRRGLEGRFQELGVPRERVPELMTVAERRFLEDRMRRDSLYDTMAEVAEAAVDLHDFLSENQGAIEHDPVRPGRVSRAPVLEAYPTTPEVKDEMDARLDRVLEGMEQVHSLKPVFTREFQDILFGKLQAVEAVDTFRLGPRDDVPDSSASGVPPGG